MNYNKIYQSLVERGKNRSLGENYKETHHIIPRCMGGSDDKNNLVDLTPEEHFVAHQLLVKMHPKHLGLIRACDIMSKECYSQSKFRTSPNKMYGWLRNRLHVPKIEIECKHCNKKFKALKCRKRKFCSKQCKIDSQKHKVTLCCKECKKDFKVTPIKAKFRKYCSPECSSKSRQKQDTKKCLCCGKLIVSQPNIIKKRKYCSNKCVNISNKGASRSPTRFAPVISKPCKQCGELIHGMPGILKQRTYCSVKCRGLSQRVKSITND